MSSGEKGRRMGVWRQSAGVQNMHKTHRNCQNCQNAKQRVEKKTLDGFLRPRPAFITSTASNGRWDATWVCCETTVGVRSGMCGGRCKLSLGYQCWWAHRLISGTRFQMNKRTCRPLCWENLSGHRPFSGSRSIGCMNDPSVAHWMSIWKI